MKKSWFKRVKHGSQPGDVSKETKIALRSGDEETYLKENPLLTPNASKAYKAELVKKGNRRTRHESSRSLFRLDD